MSGLCILTHGHGANGEPLHREAAVGLLCLHHRARLTATTAAVRDLWVDLAFILEAGSAPKDETPRTKHLKAAEAPAPANLEALALRDSRSSPLPIPPNPEIRHHEGDASTPIPPVTFIVASWLLLVAEERPLTATALPRSTLGQLALLIRHHDWIAGQEWVDDYLEEMTDLHKALSAAVRDHTHKRVGYCRLPAEDREAPCGGSLMQENGTNVIRCTNCGATWATDQERARLAVSLESA